MRRAKISLRLGRKAQSAFASAIIGKIELRATSLVWIDDAQVFTDLQNKSATIKVKIGNEANKSGDGKITANGKEFPVSWNEKSGTAEIKPDFPSAKEWNEFHPNLQKINLQLKSENAVRHAQCFIRFHRN